MKKVKFSDVVADMIYSNVWWILKKGDLDWLKTGALKYRTHSTFKSFSNPKSKGLILKKGV